MPMVLEWLDGRTLESFLGHDQGTPRGPRKGVLETFQVMDGAARALALAHALGVAHRDIKPANFFVLGDELVPGQVVKVLDFGIAKVMQAQGAQNATGMQISSFTPNYGSPEQFDRTYGATGPWTDVFQMALVLLEIMRGGAPSLGGEQFMQLAFSSQNPDRRPTPRLFGVAVTDEVEAVFNKAVALKVVDRYQSMAEFWVALAGALGVRDYAPLPTADSLLLTTTTGLATGGLAQSRAVSALVATPATQPPVRSPATQFPKAPTIVDASGPRVKKPGAEQGVSVRGDRCARRRRGRVRVDAGRAGAGGDAAGAGRHLPAIYNPKTKKVIAINALGVAPTGATVDFFKNKGYSFPPEYGPLAAVTPGTVGGLCYMLANYGTKSLEQVLKPAMELTAGYPIEAQTANEMERGKERIKQWPYSTKVFLPHLGEKREASDAGEIFVQKDLLATLNKMIETERKALKNKKGRKEAIMSACDRFYKGDIAKKFVRGCQEQGGLITMSAPRSQRQTNSALASNRRSSVSSISSNCPTGVPKTASMESFWGRGSVIGASRRFGDFGVGQRRTVIFVGAVAQMLGFVGFDVRKAVKNPATYFEVSWAYAFPPPAFQRAWRKAPPLAKLLLIQMSVAHYVPPSVCDVRQGERSQNGGV